MAKRRIGILTSGGDCPGLNATIRGVAKACYTMFGEDKVEIIGISNGYHGLIHNNCRIMKPEDFSGILTTGGTILGTKRTPYKMMQVIDNIMNNAIKYSPNGGVITVRLTQNKNHVILSISDQGLGIPRKDLGKIFDRFYRVDKARSRAQGGTGLGLAIAKEIVEAHHGRIWADSSEGKGSTFYISLPYKPMTEEDDWDEV